MRFLMQEWALGCWIIAARMHVAVFKGMLEGWWH